MSDEESLLQESLKACISTGKIVSSFFILCLIGCILLFFHCLYWRCWGYLAMFGFIMLVLFFVSGYYGKKEIDLKKKLKQLREEKWKKQEKERIKLEREQAIKKAMFEKQQRAKGLVKFVDSLGQELWGTPKQVKEWKIIDMDMRNNFGRLTPRQFEKLVKELFIEMGYEARLTPKTADYGADIVAKKGADTVVVQVKKFSPSHNVSNRDVQRLLGSMWKYDANKAIFVTTSGYTDFAYKQTTGAPIELWNKEKLYEMIEKYLLEVDSHISPFIELHSLSEGWQETEKGWTIKIPMPPALQWTEMIKCKHCGELAPSTETHCPKCKKEL